MKSITVGELRQNPTAAFSEVESGETYVVTRHHREVARLVPPSGEADLIPAKRSGPARLSERPPQHLRTAETIDDLLADMDSPW